MAAVFRFTLEAGEPPAGSSTNAPVRLGFSSSMFSGVNENDAKAAMKIWTRNILVEHNLFVAAEPQVIGGTEAIVKAVRGKLVNAMTVTAEEYWALGAKWMSTNAVLGVGGGKVTEEYVLLVHRESGVGRLEELRGRKITFFQNPRASLAGVWFETLLLESGLGRTADFTEKATQGTKLSQVVLPLFFRQTDACVVTRRGLQTMVELNPQVGRQLKVLASSPEVVPVAFLFRADCSDPAKDQILAQIENVHSTAASQQVMTLFQCENLEVHPVSALDSALALLTTHARLYEAASHGELAHTNASIPAAAADRP